MAVSGRKRAAKAKTLNLRTMTIAALDALYEDLWAALGPTIHQGGAAKRRATADLLRAADAIRIRTVIDPLDQKGGKGGAEASKRYALYEDGQSVADFIRKHGDGPHLRLDVQRGNIRLVAPSPGKAAGARRAAPHPAAKKPARGA